jgi:hypothetical protein
MADIELNREDLEKMLTRAQASELSLIDEVHRLKAKLERQQGWHMDAMVEREVEAQRLWDDLLDENTGLQKEIKALKHTIHETRDCGHHRDVSRWQITLTKATDENKTLKEENKAFGLEVLSLLGQLQDRNEMQERIDLAEGQSKNLQQTIDNLALLDQIMDSHKFIVMRKSRNLWRDIAMSAGEVIPNYNYGEYHAAWKKTIEALEEFGEEYPYVKQNNE